MSKKTLEQQIVERANGLYILKYKGKKDLRSCIKEAVEDVTHLSASQFCSIYGVLVKDAEVDFNRYINKIYNTMKNTEIN